MDEIDSLGYWVRRRRKALDLTQDALAQRVGIAHVTLRKIEADARRPSAEVAARLAAALELTGEERAAFLKVARAAEWVGDLARPALPPAPMPWAIRDRPRTNLPVVRERLIGRDAELTVVGALLQRPDVGLVTLTGPGGVGKTRLAQQVAATVLDRFADGVWFVALTSISDPALVPVTIAGVLGVKEVAGEPLTATLQRALRARELLLVLDNFEQVVVAAPVLADLLHAAPRVQALVTSRTALHLRGEHEFPVPPLALPDVTHRPPFEVLQTNAAVMLFVERAQAVNPAFALTPAHAAAVADICVRLDGLPLAIELAAARSKLLTPSLLQARLSDPFNLLVGGAHDLPARQRTLRATIDWSYRLLDPVEQRLLRWLSVFTGGCTLQAVAGVCAEEGTADIDLLATMQALIDQSLLRRYPMSGAGSEEEPRFGMLETIRAYALERLGASGEEEVLRRQHATFYRGLAEHVAPQLRSSAWRAGLALLEVDHDNLRAALQWSSGHAPEEALRLVGALRWFWYVRNYISEGRAWYDRVLRANGFRGDGTAAFGVLRTQAGARALLGAGTQACVQGDYPTGEALIEQSATLFAELGDRRGLIEALTNLLRREESVALAREVGDPWYLSLALRFLGRSTAWHGDFGRAQELYEEGLALARTTGDDWLMALHLECLAEVALVQDDRARATALYEEGQVRYADVGDHQGVGACLEGLARVAAGGGHNSAGVQRALTLYQAALRVFYELGSLEPMPNVLEGLAGLVGAHPLGGHAGAGALARWAACLLGAAEALRDRKDLPRDAAHEGPYPCNVAAIRAQLDADTFATAWAEGRAMPLEQAIMYALEGTGL